MAFTPLKVSKPRGRPKLVKATTPPLSTRPTPMSNPEFILARGSNINVSSAVNSRITRGYIRRDLDKNDPTSRFRLNFMFNPESIMRQYVAYLDQGALDPYNTIYGSGNLVAPPGILDFSFDLIFDRTIEGNRGEHNPGVQVDYDYFDRVVRASDPGVNPKINGIPDNGVLLVNPRNITVVFSNQLTVQGRPYNATITYTKFNHRMTPIRMAVSLSMKVFYIGPPAQPFDLHLDNAKATFATTVAYDSQVTADPGRNFVDVAQDINLWFPEHAADAAAANGQGTSGGGGGVSGGPGGYVNPFAHPGDPAWGPPSRIDMGVDYIPLQTSPVRAIGDGKITTCNNSSGWPGGKYLAYQLEKGTHAGLFIYVAEHLSDLLPLGTKFKAGDVLCNAHPGYPWTEWGWAKAPNGAEPTHKYNGAPHGTNMPGGLAFARFMRNLGVNPCASEEPGPGSDKPPAY